MSSKVCVIIASSERNVVLTALMYATNAKKKNWMDDVKVIFFGPSENLLAEDKEVQEALQELTKDCVACKALADRDGISDRVSQLGVKVEYVGTLISDYMKAGYHPMVW